MKAFIVVYTGMNIKNPLVTDKLKQVKQYGCPVRDSHVLTCKLNLGIAQNLNFVMTGFWVRTVPKIQLVLPGMKSIIIQLKSNGFFT